MLFNSIEYFLFLGLIFILYWSFLAKNVTLRNAFILVVSYVFYGWWDWRFLFLIAISSLCDFIIGDLIYKSKGKRRNAYLALSLMVNLGLLFFFKYYNFFIEEFAGLLGSVGLSGNMSTLNIILPVGISFYTFQTLSYTIDIWKGSLKPTKDPIKFFAFVSFFPQLVAGPIERATNLLPQFDRIERFDKNLATDGMRQILWGLFKKVAIADFCAVHVDYIFANYDSLPSNMLLLGAVYFAFQIYGDFSGYSDMAIGTAKLFGFRLMTNFRTPYFSKSVPEFWGRWHISLSTWFRDYVYIPLGGNRVSKARHIMNVLITFTVSGLWHGANRTFIFWGLLNGLYYLPSAFMGKNTIPSIDNKYLNGLKDLILILGTFFITVLTWIFFRSDDIYQAFTYLGNIFTLDLFAIPPNRLSALPNIVLMLAIEIYFQKAEHQFKVGGLPRLIRWLLYLVLTIFIFNYFTTAKSFIYFQF